MPCGSNGAGGEGCLDDALSKIGSMGREKCAQAVGKGRSGVSSGAHLDREV